MGKEEKGARKYFHISDLLSWVDSDVTYALRNKMNLSFLGNHHVSMSGGL